MAAATEVEMRNITLRLSKKTIQQARILAAKRSTSVSGLLRSEIERLANEEDSYAEAMREALALMNPGFDLGGSHKLDRDALHER